LLSFLGNEWCMNDDEVAQKLKSVMKALNLIGIGQGEAIAVYVDISVLGALLVLASIKMGLRIAICPLREPASLIEMWLKGLGIDKLVSSVAQSEIFTKDLTCFYLEDLLRTAKKLSFSQRNYDVQFSSIIRTSGTSALPKSALIFGHAHMASAYAVNSYFKVTPSSTWCLGLPLYHVSGLSILFRAFLANASIYIAKNHDELIRSLKTKKITHLSLVPTQLARLLDAQADFNGVKAIIVGGDALSVNLQQRVIALGLPVVETYGLTETASMVGVRNCDKKNEGKILSHAIIQLSKDGEILVGGKSLFAGYLDGVSLTKELTAEGLFATGDMGELSSISQLPLVVGRKSNRIISGGENIQPEEIECVLDAHPSIIESVVIGVKDEYFGIQPCAYIKWVYAPLHEADLLVYLKSHLAAYKIPKKFLLWPKDTPIGPKKPRHWLSLCAQRHERTPLNTIGWTNLS
jgi:O-succinylbenzoic acid--CoA ligase